MSFDQLDPNDQATIGHLLELRDQVGARIDAVEAQSNQADAEQEIDRLIRAGLIESSSKPADSAEFAQFLSDEQQRIREDAFVNSTEVKTSMRQRVQSGQQSVEEALGELGIDPLHPKQPLLDRLHLRPPVQWAASNKLNTISLAILALSALVIAVTYVGNFR